MGFSRLYGNSTKIVAFKEDEKNMRERERKRERDH
jgi:hypothetical protein